MIYVLYGTESFLIDKEIQKIKVEKRIDDFCFSTYNAKINEFDLYLMDAISMPLFGNQKLIVIEDAYYFSSEKAPDDKILIKIEHYLENINEKNIIVFKVNAEKIDERKKITKLAKKVGIVKEFNNKMDSSSLIKDLLKEYKISSENIALIKEKLNNNIELINNEMLKLMIYKDNNEITATDIENVISDYPNIDFFTFIDDIIKKDVSRSLRTYNELLNLKEEPIKMIVTLANQFRLMYQAKKLFQSGYTEADIASELGEHPYRVKLALQKSKNYPDDILLDNLKRLGEMDYNTKKGLVDSKLALELFILELKS